MEHRERHFGSIIREARLDHALTQEAIANDLGVNQNAVSSWEKSPGEKGKSYPAPGNLLGLARMLDLNVEDLIRSMVAETEQVPA